MRRKITITILLFCQMMLIIALYLYARFVHDQAAVMPYDHGVMIVK